MPDDDSYRMVYTPAYGLYKEALEDLGWIETSLANQPFFIDPEDQMLYEPFKAAKKAGLVKENGPNYVSF